MATYLHYLDRELRASVDAGVGDDLMRDVTAVVAVTTSSLLYCSVSFVFETCLHFKRLSTLTSQLLQAHQLMAVSGHPTLEEFLASRRSLYAHDVERYPMYFQDAGVLADTLTPIHKRTSATQSLVHAIQRRCDNAEIQVSPGLALSVKDSLRRGMDVLADKAVTFAAFKPHLPDGRTEIAGSIRRTISEEYARHYLGVYDGDIITGIRGLGYFDYLARRFPLLDYALLRTIARRTLPSRALSTSDGVLPEPLLVQRGEAEHVLFAELIQLYIETFKSYYGDIGIAARDDTRNKYVATIRAADFPQVDERRARTQPYRIGCEVLRRHIDDRCHSDSRFREAHQMVQISRKHGPTRILLATATDLEDDVLGHYMKERRMVAKVSPGKKGAYATFGGVGNCELFWVRSRMGSTGPNASEVTMLDAVDDLKPHYVISYGIAFGKGPKQQHIGDVMVSEWVRLYEKQRVSEKTVDARGERLAGCGVLLQLASIARQSFEACDVHAGGLMSGDKLVDNANLKAAIFAIEPEAIGGDMEGGGIVSACSRRSVSWLVVKGICDWGENKNDSSRNKQQDQTLAAGNAIAFVFKMLSEGVLPLPVLRQA